MLLALLIIQTRFELLATSRMRYFLLLWFPGIIIFAYGLTSIPWKTVIIALIVPVWVWSAITLIDSEQVLEFAGFNVSTRAYPPLQEYVYLLRDRVWPRDHLIGFTEDVGLNSGNKGYSISDYYLKAQLGIDGVFLHARLKRYRLESDVKGILAAHPQVLLAHNPSDEPLNYARTLEYVTQDFIPCTVLVDNSDLHIQRYVHPVLGCEHDAAAIEYENGIQILDHAAHFDAEAERIQVFTWWDVPEEDLLDQFNISLQVISPDWENVRQIDRHLYHRIVPWNVIDLSTADLPAGEYRLILILYDRDSLAKVNGQALPNGETADNQTLLSFSIGDH